MRRVEKGILSVYNRSAVAAHIQNSLKQNTEHENRGNSFKYYSVNSAIFREDGLHALHALTSSPFPAAQPHEGVHIDLTCRQVPLASYASRPYYYLLHVLMDWDRQRVQHVSNVPQAKVLQPIAKGLV